MCVSEGGVHSLAQAKGGRRVSIWVSVQIFGNYVRNLVPYNIYFGVLGGLEALIKVFTIMPPNALTVSAPTYDTGRC